MFFIHCIPYRHAPLLLCDSVPGSFRLRAGRESVGMPFQKTLEPSMGACFGPSMALKTFGKASPPTRSWAAVQNALAFDPSLKGKWVPESPNLQSFNAIPSAVRYCPSPQSGFRDLLPKISKAMDGLREAHMGEASVYEAKLHAQPNDSNL
jgi:hypothetical protein